MISVAISEGMTISEAGLVEMTSVEVSEGMILDQGMTSAVEMILVGKMI